IELIGGIFLTFEAIANRDCFGAPRQWSFQAHAQEARWSYPVESELFRECRESIVDDLLPGSLSGQCCRQKERRRRTGYRRRLNRNKGSRDNDQEQGALETVCRTGPSALF